MILKQKALCSSGRVLDAGERRSFFFSNYCKNNFFFHKPTIKNVKINSESSFFTSIHICCRSVVLKAIMNPKGA